MSNTNLHKARKEKNDEFYTMYSDIENELSHYGEQLNGMVVYCNCDDYRISNFVKFFKTNFNKLGLRGLISTNYNIGNGAFKYVYDGVAETITPLHGDGSFLSDECVRILNEEADVVITNPPFSLFRDFIALMTNGSKDVLAVGTKVAVGTNNIISKFKDGTLSIGNETPNDFIQPNSNTNMKGLCRWFTTFKTKRNVSLRMTNKYYPENYTRYDNFDAINIDRVADIPKDYYGVMGVPVTFMDYYNDKQFEIVGIANRGCSPELLTKVYTDEPNAKDLNGSACILVDGNLKALSTRIFIRRIRRTLLGKSRKSTAIEKTDVRMGDHKRITRKQIGSYNYPFISDYDKFSVDKESILSHKPIEHLYLRGSPQRKKHREAA